MALFQRSPARRAARFSIVLIALLLLGVALLAARWTYAQWKSPPASALVLARPRPLPAFPLKVEPGKRHLVDAAGAPFLIQGDAAWSLIADLTRAEVDIYLADRRARGFNTLLVSLIEHKFARNAPSNIYGDDPFTEPDSFGKPNEAYFDHAEWVLRRARDMGFAVLLTPAYLGWLGEGDGWWQAMTRTSPDVLRGYGRFLGRRFGGLDNIIWTNAGDHDPPDKALVAAIAEGLKSVAPQQLHTAHNAPETFVPDFWEGAGWLDLTSVYTYRRVCGATADAYRHASGRPAFLIESTYEFEQGAGAAQVRRQAYSALLCGASGQVFGNNPIWHFHHGGIYPAPTDWWHALGSEGAQSMTHLGDLFTSLPWWELTPDLDGTLIVAGRGEGDEQAAAALTGDRTLAVIYLPASREITVDLGRFAGRSVAASWVDPASGASSEAAPPLEISGGVRRFAPAGRNAGGDRDWVLLLRASP